MGPAFGVAGWLAVLYVAYRAARFRETKHLLLVAFVALGWWAVRAFHPAPSARS